MAFIKVDRSEKTGTFRNCAASNDYPPKEEKNMKMYRKPAVLILCLFLFASAAFGESNAETAWYELSDDECVITLRLPVVNDDGWTFEI